MDIFYVILLFYDKNIIFSCKYGKFTVATEFCHSNGEMVVIKDIFLSGHISVLRVKPFRENLSKIMDKWLWTREKFVYITGSWWVLLYQGCTNSWGWGTIIIDETDRLWSFITGALTQRFSTFLTLRNPKWPQKTSRNPNYLQKNFAEPHFSKLTNST